MILFGMLGAMTFALKVAMAALPNIEPVSLTLLIYAVVFGWKALYPTYIYVIMEILYFGLGTWNICYLYVWPVLAVATCLHRSRHRATPISPTTWRVSLSASPTRHWSTRRTS